MMGNSFCKPCGASGAATNTVNHTVNTVTSGTNIGSNTDGNNESALAVETRNNEHLRNSKAGKGAWIGLVKKASASASTSNTSGGNDGSSSSKADGKKAGMVPDVKTLVPESEAPLNQASAFTLKEEDMNPMERQIFAISRNIIINKHKSFDQLQPHYEEVIEIAMRYEHQESEHEDTFIGVIPDMLMEHFHTWHHDTAAPIFTKALELMKNRAKVFRDRNETLETDLLQLTEVEKLPSDHRKVKDTRRALRPNQNKALTMYSVAHDVLIRYGGQWKDDPRTLPLFEETLQMAYEQCHLLNRMGHANNLDTLEKAETHAQRVFNLLEQALSSEHRSISDLAYTNLAAFKNEWCESLRKQGKVDVVTDRYNCLVESYKSRHGADNIPLVMEEVD